MRRLIQLIRAMWSLVNRSPKFSTKRRSMLIGRTFKKGHTVCVCINPDGNWFDLLFQRPLGLEDRDKDGKFINPPASWIKRRGGKRQTVIRIGLESAKALHLVLGKAIKNAEEKQEQVEWDRTLFHMVDTMTKTALETKR